MWSRHLGGSRVQGNRKFDRIESYLGAAVSFVTLADCDGLLFEFADDMSKFANVDAATPTTRRKRLARPRKACASALPPSRSASDITNAATYTKAAANCTMDIKQISGPPAAPSSGETAIDAHSKSPAPHHIANGPSTVFKANLEMVITFGPSALQCYQSSLLAHYRYCLLPRIAV